MVPVWGPCAARRAASVASSSSSSFLTGPCRSAIGRLSHRIPQSESLSKIPRPLLPIPSRREFSLLQQSGARVQDTLKGPRSHLQKSMISPYRLLASLRRPSSRRPDANPSSGPASNPVQPSNNPPAPDAPENASVQPTTADPNSGSLAPVDSNSMKVGSSEWYDYYRARARLSNKEAPDEMPAIRRLTPSFIFLLIVLAGSYYYASTYVPPAKDDRMFPRVPMALATVLGIIGVNFLVLVAWRIPPFWRTLNKYFAQCPGEPVALALLGNTFSHHQFWHFGMNMLALFFLGTTLCNQIGRGNFLALYMSSAALSSFGSLAVNVYMRRFHVFGLGASGAVYGVLGGFAMLNPDSELYFVLLPLFTVKAVTMATIMGVYEFVALIFSWSIWMDHAAHLFGLLSGAGLTAWLRAEAKRRREMMVARQLGRA
ncbi:hypothetical protein DRE_00052 [Drechslerella stenobrocha 248]|uniref:Peptidase S54 rhomboid domain-containing protein n=1 Tax=Drechslerella stenobrocha 248 TaxID=1043628 RepID=W7I9I4_9PEZI|nr:hypothetical protein DRE_00052 [Drechslerella stenobrocha 248]